MSKNEKVRLGSFLNTDSTFINCPEPVSDIWY